MDSLQKLIDLGRYMDVEPAEETPCPPLESAAALRALPQPQRERCSIADLPVSRATLPSGRQIKLLKSVLTSACERNCNYCAFRSGRDFRRATFSPDEMAQSFMRLVRGGVVEGIFLSSGVAGGGVRTQDRLLAAAELIRKKYHFQGYLHLKVMPGSQRAQVEQAMRLADRVSVNLEAPTSASLARLAPQKVFLEELLEPLRWIEDIRRDQPAHLGWKRHWPSSCTQFVAGGAGETDLELLGTSEYLHNQLRLARVYFSGFQPVEDTPLENQPAINPWRQNRLYQADFLLRDYGFTLEDLPFSPTGSLPLETDPKLAWAQQHLAHQPLEINRAEMHELLRIPGIGPRSARLIISARQKNQLRHVEDLKAIGVRAARALPFILLDGSAPPQQAALADW